MTASTQKPVLGIVMGDAAGIGPEIILKALAKGEINSLCSPFVIGSRKIMELAAESMQKKIDFKALESVGEMGPQAETISVLDCGIANGNFQWGIADPVNGSNAVTYIKKGVELAIQKEIDAMVIAPLNKESMHKGGLQFPDEITLLGHLVDTKVRTVVKWNDIFRSTVVGHVAFKQITEMVTKDHIIPVIENLNNVIKQFGVAVPRIGVAALNPHGGEGGAFGDEEIREIAPAVVVAREMGIEVSGPYPADTIFVRAMEGQLDGVVFLYHDQGNIALKSAAFGRGVLIYTGLPFPCASVVHGSAYDKAGNNVADSAGFEEAVKTAVKMSSYRIQ